MCASGADIDSGSVDATIPNARISREVPHQHPGASMAPFKRNGAISRQPA